MSFNFKRSAFASASQIALTAKQSNIYQWGWQDEARFRVAPCGRRFGKTYLAAAEIKRAYRRAVELGVNNENEIWYGAPTFKQAKRVFWRRIKRAIPRSWKVKTNESECSIELKGGYIFRVVGLDNYDDLRGSGLWFFVGDEFADSKFEAWEEVIRPMLSTCNGHALFIGTPKGYNHFYDFYQYGQQKLDGFMSWQYTTIQGGNVPQSEIDHARKTLDAMTFRQEYNASFENYAGRVYYAFNRQHHIGDYPYDPALPLHVGMDFNVNPMTATIWQEVMTKEGLFSRQIDEVLLPSSDTLEMCKEIGSRYGKIGFDGEVSVDHITIYPDPAGAQRRTSALGKTDIKILVEYGFRVVALNSHPLVRDRINCMNARFESADGEHHVGVDRKCRRSIETYERLAYEEGRNEPDKKATYLSSDITMDHLGDCSGYYFFCRFGQAKVKHLFLGHGAR